MRKNYKKILPTVFLLWSIGLSSLMGCVSSKIGGLEREIKKDYGKLVVERAWVLDNGEGDLIPIKSKGELHLLVYDDEYGCPGNSKNYENYLNHIVLQGPSKNEWRDGDEKYFKNLKIFKWRGEKDSVLVFVYESDPWNWGEIWDRKHDALFCQRVVKRKFNQVELYRGGYRCSKDVIKKFKDNPPSWLKNVWRNYVDKDAHKMYMKLKTVH